MSSRARKWIKLAVQVLVSVGLVAFLARQLDFGEIKSILDRPGGWPWLLLKVGFFASAFIWFRASFPRYRYDQIMRLGWKVFIPLTIAWIAVTALMVFFGVFEKGV